MKEFFHGWRRKAGAAGLVMACVLTILWVRSCIVIDNVRLPFSNQRLELATFRGVLYLELRRIPPGFRNQLQWHVRSADPTVRMEAWNLLGPTKSIPFRQLAVAFGLLSAYLILWKPRKRS
jgi:hypothetical protein